MKKWWIGCSGFYYKGWRGKFYPEKLPRRKWFEYYCQYFNTVELNVTFYRLPKHEVLRGWHARSPSEFRFTVKAPRLITHYKRFNNVQKEIAGFYDLVLSGLEEKLGPVLFQLHPTISYSEETLHRIIDALDPAFTNVIEFRHASWWNPRVVRTLAERNICFSGISYPGLPEQVMRGSPAMYYRFHGIPQLYLSSYSDGELNAVAREISTRRGVKDVYAYFNNDIEVAAVYNAQTLQQLVGQPVVGPETILP
jgi:uncharacterized protein YecE (DUF72 family)